MSETNAEKIVFKRPDSLLPVITNYCPGCPHGIVNRLVAETMDELGIEGKTVGVCPVGCSVMAYKFFGCDMIEAAHGRAPAVATGAKRVNPDNVVFAYQGDGDLASIGMAETVHAATRGEHISVIFINNAIYGMTGGQMAPTTLIGQRATTCVDGRTVAQAGLPLKVCEMLAAIPCAVYVERVMLNSPANVRKAKKAVNTALDIQMAGLGFTFVEFLSACPTNWGLTPVDALKWVEQNMADYFPIGNFRKPEGY